MAPKKKEKNLKRSNIITLKLTDIELAVLNEAADVTGLSRSEYVRKLLLEKQINHQIEVVADMNDLRKLVSEYGKIGSNLNQIAKQDVYKRQVIFCPPYILSVKSPLILSFAFMALLVIITVNYL